MSPQWLNWIQRIQAIAQTGLSFSAGMYDLERYRQLRDIAAEMISEASGEPVGEISNAIRWDRGYATPKVEVRAAVFNDGQILLVREREDGGWTLPGGWADVGQSASECVVREVKEESGLAVTPRKLIAVWDRDKHPHPPLLHQTYKMFFHCELLGGQLQTSYETTEVGFFREDNLPPLSLPRILPEQLQHCFDHARHPEWPTTFD